MTEAIYDAKIAPLLLAAGQICQDNGLSFVALVEYAPGECASTMTATNPGMEMQVSGMAVRSRGNIDALIMGIMKYARAHGHSSIFLKQLGVPLNPPVLGADAPTQPKGN